MSITPSTTSANNKRRKIWILVAIGLLALSGTLIAGNVIYNITGGFHHHGISISVSESGVVYRFAARYPPEKVKQVNELLQNRLRPYVTIEFRNDRIYATITKDHAISIQLKAFPGSCELLLFKEQSSEEAYQTCKQAGKDIGNIIGR
jgi:hypothetical protein